MKKHISSLVFGIVGICSGFALCFLYLVLPTREPLERGHAVEQAMKVFSHLSHHHDNERGSYFTLP